MPTIINNPSGESSGAGLIVGVVVAILLIILFFVYGLPAIRGTNDGGNGGANINVQLPAGSDNSSGQ